jgi:hypothetical protein
LEVHKPQVLRSVIRLCSKASPGAYSTYRNAILSLALFIYACVDCALHIGFLDDGNMLHGSTLPYITLVGDVFIFID